MPCRSGTERPRAARILSQQQPWLSRQPSESQTEFSGVQSYAEEDSMAEETQIQTSPDQGLSTDIRAPLLNHT
jgi:hypothetical protein